MRRSQSGVSLFEGVVTLVLGSVLLLMVAPIFMRMANDQLVVTFTNELVVHLQQARQAAVGTGSRVSLCSSDNGRHCTETPWSRGYMLFTDGGEAGLVDSRDQVIKVVTGREPKLRVTLNGAPYVQFLGSGGLASASPQPRQNSPVSPPSLLSRLLHSISPISLAHAAPTMIPMPAAAEPVAFLVCSGKIGRAVRLSAVGRPNTTTVDCQ